MTVASCESLRRRSHFRPGFSHIHLRFGSYHESPEYGSPTISSQVDWLLWQKESEGHHDNSEERGSSERRFDHSLSSSMETGPAIIAPRRDLRVSEEEREKDCLVTRSGDILSDVTKVRKRSRVWGTLGEGYGRLPQRPPRRTRNVSDETQGEKRPATG